jgi:hypothetical protein
MSDPLSIAASIVGLGAAAAQIARLLTTIIEANVNAPKALRDARTELSQLEFFIQPLQWILNRLESLPPERTSLIPVEAVIVTLTDIIMAMGDLESEVQQLVDKADRRLHITKILWLQFEKKISDSMERVQRHKTSIITILSILQG